MYIQDVFLDWHSWVWRRWSVTLFRCGIGIAWRTRGLIVVISLWPLRFGMGRS